MRYVRPGLITVVAVGVLVLAAAGAFSLTRSDDSGVKAAAIQPEVTETLAQETAVGVIISLRTGRPPAALDLPALKQEVAAKQGSVLSALSPSDFTVTHQYDAVPAIAGRISAAGLEKLANHPDVALIEIDRVGYGTLGQSVPLINADDVHSDLSTPATGANIVVAVLDTGVFTGHNDLSDGDILSETCFLTSVGMGAPGPCPANGLDTCFGGGCAADDNGHGTHVTGIITSSGVSTLVGVAPDADIHAYKVLNAGATGWFSDFVAALNDIIANRPDVDLVNMSLGDSMAWGPGNCDGMAIATAINILRAGGVTTVVASGNDGFKFGMNLPACVSTAVSVGMTYDANFATSVWSACTDTPANQNQIACASNSDRSLDLLAPGAEIDSLSHLVAGGTVMKKGTSMATPHVVGVMALALELDGTHTPDTLEYCLESSALLSPMDVNGIQTPLVDAYEAAIGTGGACQKSPTPVDQAAIFSVRSPDIVSGAVAQPCEASALLALPGATPCTRGAPTPDWVLAPSSLGLDIQGAMSDELDAISLDEPFVGPLAPAFHFSVDDSAVGAAGCTAPDVNSQATLGEAQGDIFTDLAPPASPIVGCNAQFQDEFTQGLIAPAATPAFGTDDMDALTEAYAGAAINPTCPAALGGVCPPFSVASGSTVVGSADAFGMTIGTANLLVPPGTPQTGIVMGGPCPAAAGALPCVALSEGQLGLVAGDDLDALCWFDNQPDGLPDPPPWIVGPGIDGDDYFFSLASGSPTLAGLGAGPGAVLAPPPLGSTSPWPVVVAPAAAIGLLGTDNLDGLKCINGGGAQLATLPGVADVPHYKSYKIFDEDGSAPSEYVTVETQFLTEEDLQIGREKFLFVPAMKYHEEEWSGDLDEPHLKCYDIEQYSEDNPGVEVDLETQFGTEQVVVGQAKLLCVPTLKTVTAPEPTPTPPAGPLPSAPHYKCYSITGLAPDPAVYVDLETQFSPPLEEDVEILQPSLLCAPAKKTILPGGEPEGDLTVPHLKCYDIDEPALSPPRHADLETQFSDDELDVVVDFPKHLCVPVLKEIVPEPTPEAHYQCYYSPAEYAGVSVDLETQFGKRFQVPIGQAINLCAPAKKDGEGPELNDTHLKCYYINPDPLDPTPVYDWDPDYVVDLHTQFGWEYDIEVGQAHTLCAPTTKAFGPDVPPPPPDDPHYVCHYIRYDTGNYWYPTLQTQFEPQTTREVGPEVWWLCAPAKKNDVGNLDLPHLKCYDTIYTTGGWPANLRTQFSTEMGQIILNSEMLCMEADKVVVDTTPPDVTIDQAVGQADPTNASPINFTVVFSEPVIGFASGDVTLSGGAGATTDTVTGGPATYNVAVTGMTLDGTVIADIGAGVAQDAVGNPNNASTSTDNTVTYDTTAPDVTIDQAVGQADPTNASPINFTAVFNEPVMGFASGDVSLSGTAGATTDTVTLGPTTYNVAVTGMTLDGTVIADIGAGVAQDAAGNPNNASTSTDNTVTYDTTAVATQPLFSASDLATAGGHDITPNLNAGGLECSSEDLLTVPGGTPGGGACAARVAPAPAGPVPDAVTLAPADLGLGGMVPGPPAPFFDDLNAVSFGELMNNGAYDFDFSVDAVPAQGGVTVGTNCGAAPNVWTEAAIPEAQGDIFNTGPLPAGFGCNLQSTDEGPLGLIAPNPWPAAAPLDEMDALTEIPAAGPTAGLCTLVNGSVASICPAFSIMDGGTSTLGSIPADAHSGGTPDEGSILVPPSAPLIPPAIPFGGCAGYTGGAGVPCVAVHSSHLGLVGGSPGGGDDIDALCWFDTDGDSLPDLPNPWFPGGGDYYIFSLTPSSPSVTGGPTFSAADVLTVNPIAGQPPVVLVTAAQLGLLASDNVDGLICRDFDTDVDGVPDQLDNCPSTGNTPQINTDYALNDEGVTIFGAPVPADADGDACDDDDDNDSPTLYPTDWEDTLEFYLTNDPNSEIEACPRTPGADDYWMPDPNMDRKVDSLDLIPFKNAYQAVPGGPGSATRRMDYNGDTLKVDALDLIPFKHAYQATCTVP